MSEPAGYLPYDPDRDPSGTRPARPPSPGHRVGRVEGVTTRVEGRGPESSSQTVLGFRLVDPETRTVREVELRGRTISGTLRDGDWVEVPGEPGRSGRLEPVRVTNLSTQSEVSAGGSSRGPAARVVAVLVVLVFLVVLGVVLVGVLGFFDGPGF